MLPSIAQLTDWLAACAGGVNLPCHLVIVKGTEYFDANTHSYVDFPVTDILQMIGRAGRPQFDSSAVACIFVHEAKKQFYRKFLHEPFPVESSLHLQLHEHFNAEIANHSIHSVHDSVEYLTWTYLYRRLLVNPAYYGVASPHPEAIRAFLMQLVMTTLQELQSAQCIECAAGDMSALRITSLGLVASYYYLTFRTPVQMLGAFRSLAAHHYEETDLALRLMKVMCDAPEFSQLPVRHNEEHLNAELAHELGVAAVSAQSEDMLSPHTKAYLLLLAHMARHRLPITDYINDLKSVLDQAPRVLNAMIDIAAEEGYQTLVLGLVKLSQCIKQVQMTA